MTSTKNIHKLAKKLKRATKHLSNGEIPPTTPLKTHYLNKTEKEIIEYLKNPAKCEEQGLDWFLEMHVHGHLLKKDK